MSDKYLTWSVRREVKELERLSLECLFKSCEWKNGELKSLYVHPVLNKLPEMIEHNYEDFFKFTLWGYEEKLKLLNTPVDELGHN